MTVATQRLQQNFNRAAARYDTHAWLQQQQLDRVLTYALQHLPACATLLDIGCGTGHFALIARQPRPEWRIVGLDLAFDMAHHAATRCATLQADAAQLPVGDGTVDAVVSSLCMQWVNDKPAMLREIRRVLKPGGTAIITTLGPDTLKELRHAAALASLPLGLLAMEPFEQYRAMAADAGLVLTAGQHMLETHHYTSVETLLDSMRLIGAGNASPERGRTFIAPRRFAAMIQHYEAAYGTAKGIPATWEPVLLVVKRA